MTFLGCIHIIKKHNNWVHGPVHAAAQQERALTLAAASAEKEYCVLAMQMGSPPKPMRVYSSICASARGRYSTLPAPYVSRAIASIFSCAPQQRDVRTALAASCAVFSSASQDQAGLQLD